MGSPHSLGKECRTRTARVARIVRLVNRQMLTLTCGRLHVLESGIQLPGDGAGSGISVAVDLNSKKLQLCCTLGFVRFDAGPFVIHTCLIAFKSMIYDRYRAAIRVRWIERMADRIAGRRKPRYRLRRQQ